MFPVVTVHEDAANIIEQLGTKPKFWYKYDNVDYLFKEVRPTTGEDWAEKAASELFALVGIPFVKYDLAIWRDKKGVICPSFVPPGCRLVHGNELLAKVEPTYPGKMFYRVKQYTLRRVLAILGDRRLKVPIGYENILPVSSAIEVFVGYLMMDAWLANQDRHHENWGLMLVSGSKSIHLTPSYDHASSLGSHENDNNRLDRLNTRDSRRSMEQYVSKGESPFFVSPSAEKPLTTLEAFIESANRKPKAAKIWLSRLEDVSLSDMKSILDQVPENRISTIEINFAHKILELNQQRLLKLKGKWK